MPRDVAADLATVLESAGLALNRPPAGLKNLYLGPLPDDDDAQIPDACVSILATGGDPPEPYIGGTKQSYLAATCQVYVRGPREDFAAGQAFAFGVMDALNLSRPAGYVNVHVRESSPFYVRTDGADRHQWVVNVVAEYLYTPT